MGYAKIIVLKIPVTHLNLYLHPKYKPAISCGKNCLPISGGIKKWHLGRVLEDKLHIKAKTIASFLYAGGLILSSSFIRVEADMWTKEFFVMYM